MQKTADGNPTPKTKSQWLSAEMGPVPIFLRSDTVIYEPATQRPVDELVLTSGLAYRHSSACQFPARLYLGAKTIKRNTNSTQNKSQTHRAKQYEVTSFLSTDCELSTETCSKNVYSLGPRSLEVAFGRVNTSSTCVCSRQQSS